MKESQLNKHTALLICWRTIFCIYWFHCYVVQNCSIHFQTMSQTSPFCCHCCSAAKLCLTLCNPMNCSPPGSSAISRSLLKFTSKTFQQLKKNNTDEYSGDIPTEDRYSLNWDSEESQTSDLLILWGQNLVKLVHGRLEPSRIKSCFKIPIIRYLEFS